MKSRQIARMEAGERVVIYNGVTANALQLATIENYPVVATGISDTLIEIKDSSTEQSKDLSGLAPTKEQLRVIMGDTILVYSLRAGVDAALANNTELGEEVDHAITYYLQGKASLGESRASATTKLISEKLGVFKSVKPADVLLMKAAIDAFVAKKESPTTEKQAKKVEGTDQMEPLLDKLDHFINLESNLIHSYFPKSLLAEGFDLTSKLILHGSRHSPVDIHIVDALRGHAIGGAKVKKVGTKLFAMSDDEGLAHFDTSKVGTQIFSIEAIGYVMTEITAIVRRGIGVELVVKMVGIA